MHLGTVIVFQAFGCIGKGMKAKALPLKKKCIRTTFSVTFR